MCLESAVRVNDFPGLGSVLKFFDANLTDKLTIVKPNTEFSQSVFGCDLEVFPVASVLVR